MRIAVSGDAGSFSEEAGLLYAQRIGVDLEIVYSINMDGVLKKCGRWRVRVWNFSSGKFSWWLGANCFYGYGKIFVYHGR